MYASHFEHNSAVSMMNLQILDLQSWGVQLEQCQLVKYDTKSGRLGMPLDVHMVGTDCVCVCMCVCRKAKLVITLSQGFNNLATRCDMLTRL